MTWLTDLTSSDMYKDAVSLGKTYIAANGSMPVGALNTAPLTMAGDGSVQVAGRNQPVTGGNPLSDALNTLAGAYAAKESNRELNKNPPYWLYGLIGLGLVGLYIVVRK